MSILSVQNIAKRYRFRDVVKGISVEIKSGEVVGLLGPNGAGKTTAFYMIVGLVAADKGRILLDGRDVTPLPMHRRAAMGIGYLPQEASIFPQTDGRAETSSPSWRTGMTSTERVASTSLTSYWRNCTSGTYVPASVSAYRAANAAAWRSRARLPPIPRFVLLDEPFAGVDPISVLDIQRIIRHLCDRDIGVLITDHNVRETLGICGRAYILNDGTLIASGTPDRTFCKTSTSGRFISGRSSSSERRI